MVNEKGEVIARGNNVIDGYWNRPEKTERTVVDGWFHTGDLATIDEDGYVRIVDRTKDIISGGENIGTPEVENVIAGRPSVLECAVVAAPHGIWGETPAALVALKEEEGLTKEALIAHCKYIHIAGFKAPRLVEFLGSLPKVGTGKVLKRELKERFCKGRRGRVAQRASPQTSSRIADACPHATAR